jgi:hypothetical protein
LKKAKPSALASAARLLPFFRRRRETGAIAGQSGLTLPPGSSASTGTKFFPRTSSSKTATHGLFDLRHLLRSRPDCNPQSAKNFSREMRKKKILLCSAIPGKTALLAKFPNRLSEWQMRNSQ